MTSDFSTKIIKVKTALEAIFVKKSDRSHISYGQVDSTSTSTDFTATVTGLTSLTDGATVMLRNGVITSAEGFTLNVNGLGAKPVYNSMADATRDTTIFNINYTMLFVYDSTRIEGGCWMCYRGYNSDKDTNTIGYQIRTNSSTYIATDKFVRYRLLLEVSDGQYMPVNTSTSTSGTASKSSAMNTREFKIGGRIMYYGTTAAVSADTQIAGIAYLWTQINLVLGYSFSNSSSGPSLTTGEPVYMIAKPSTTNKGMAKLNTPYYTQSLPSTADDLIYIYLGQATDATHIELLINHPIYEYKNGGIRLYREYYDSSEIDTFLNSKSDTGHTHSNYINPTIVDNLTTDDATKVLSAKQGKVLQDNKLEKVHSSYKGKNVVTNASTGAIEFEDKYSHPSTHTSSMITDSNTYNNIGNTANTLDNILSNINSKLGTLATIDLVEVTTNKGTASASTMNKLYLVAESSSATNDNYEIFVTVRTGTSGNYNYAWEKIDTARIDLSGYLTTSNASSTYLSKTDASSTYVAKETGKGLFSGSYSDLTNKPSYSATVTSSTTDSVKIGSININGSNVDIYATNTVYTHPTPSGLGGAKTSGLYKVAVDAQGHITGTASVGASDLPSHTHNYSTFSGNYEDLTNKPTIPLATSDLTNDGNGEEPFLTHSDISAVGITNSYEDLDDKPTIPSAYTHPSTHPASMITGLATVATSGKTSDLNNDSGFLTSHNPIDSSLSSSSENAVQNKVINTALGNKVDKVSGKGLSTNDFDATYKGYVDNLVSSGDTTKNAHVHGNIGSGGTLNSDISTVNKIAVTDSSNNLKTISQIPYSKVSGTPTLSTVATSGKASDLTNDNNTFATGNHNHSGVYSESTHGHGFITHEGKFADPQGYGAPLKVGSTGYIGAGTFGTNSGEFAEGNHTHTASEIGFTAGTGFGDAAPNITDTSTALNYVMEDCNLKANINDIPTTTSQLTNDSGFLTSHQSLTPTRVYNCTSWTSYINTSASNLLSLYKLGDMYLLRYFVTTNTLTYSTTDYNMNDDTIGSNYRPSGDRTFHVSTSSSHNAKITITTNGKIKISTDANSTAVSLAGSVMYWW